MTNNLKYETLENNKLKYPKNKKNKILILTFDNRKHFKYIDLHNKNIQDYADKWCYDYIFLNKCDHNVYWCKIYLVLKYLNTNKYDYVMWLDSDTKINNFNIKLDDIINHYDSDIYISYHISNIFYCINAGIFIIKNSVSQDCFIENNKLSGIMAGSYYEQGIMDLLLMNKYKKYATGLPNYLFLNYWNCNKKCFYISLYK